VSSGVCALVGPELDEVERVALARGVTVRRPGPADQPVEREFTRVIKTEVGTTAADHVEAIRLESACRLLETTNRSIGQVAKACGFGTPETMNRTFRRRINTTPGDHHHYFTSSH
jgi:transcriptional regulator GlxA family with amidase domain